METSAAIYLQLEANRRHPLPDSGELQRVDGGPEQGVLIDRLPCLVCGSNNGQFYDEDDKVCADCPSCLICGKAIVHCYDQDDEICADCYPIQGQYHCQQCRSHNLDFSYIIGDGYYADCLDCGNFEKFQLKTSQTRVENQIYNFSQQNSHLQIEEGCHGGPEPYVNSHLQIQEGCHGGPEPYVNSHLQI